MGDVIGRIRALIKKAPARKDGAAGGGDLFKPAVVLAK